MILLVISLLALFLAVLVCAVRAISRMDGPDGMAL
jgi:hypothetical protein